MSGSWELAAKPSVAHGSTRVLSNPDGVLTQERRLPPRIGERSGDCGGLVGRGMSWETKGTQEL